MSGNPHVYCWEFFKAIPLGGGWQDGTITVLYYNDLYIGWEMQEKS